MPLPAQAAGGDLDRSFGAGAGYVTFTAQYDAHWQMTGAVALADGRAVIGGYLDLKYVVRRYFPDGRLDTSFGTNGSSEIPDLARQYAGGGVFGEAQLYLDGAGRIYAAAGGLVRRLNAAGQYDADYQPGAINHRYYPGGYASATFLPLSDGRMIYVATQDAPMATNFISVRYYLADGSPDTQRGGTYGERLIGPATGRYEPTHALLQPDGKLVISAYWVQPTKIGLVLLRLNADASTDVSFGSGGVAVIGEDMAGVRAPTLASTETGALALTYYVFGGDVAPPSQSYFVVHLLQADGRADTGQPMSGRISVMLPNEYYSSMFPRNLRAAYAASRLSVFADQFFWQMNLAAGGSAPTVSTVLSYPIEAYPSPAVLGGAYLWRLVRDEPIYSGRALLGFGNSYASVIAADLLPSGQALQIRDSQRADAKAWFRDLDANANGSVTVAGNTDVNRYTPLLFRFGGSGALDTGFGQLGFTTVGDGKFDPRLVDTYGGGTTLLSLGWDPLYPRTLVNSLLRFDAGGARESGFASAGELMLPSAGFSALRVASGTLWAVGSAYSTTQLAYVLRPFLYDAAGRPLGTAGAVQAASGPFTDDSVALAPWSDGGVLAAAAGSDAILGPWVQLFRWRSDGSAAPGSPTAAAFIDEHYASVDRVEVVANADGSVVAALALRGYAFALQPATLFVLARFKADGTLDASFGDSGKLRFPADVDDTGAVLSGVSWQRLVRQSDGKLVLAGYGPSGTGTSIVVARYTADGRPDGTFGSGGNHEVRFALADQERVYGMTQAADGKLLLAGQSGNKGLLLRLHGESTPPPATPVAVVEFYNSQLQHYFVTGGGGEIAAIESGAAGPGWSRTGQSFKAYAPETGTAPGAQPVCRFYGTPGVGPNSHFYTVDATECANVKHDPGWTYEGLAFYIFATNNGGCAAGQVPVYRAYNMRFAQNDSNHRYTTDSATYAQMLAQGWAGEGVKFCGAP